MAKFDIDMRNTLIERLQEKNEEMKNMQNKFINNIDYSNSILIEFELKDLCEEMSKILRNIRICNIEDRRDEYIKRIIKRNFNIEDIDTLESVLNRIPLDIRVKGRSEKNCKSKEFEEDIICFVKREKLV